MRIVIIAWGSIIKNPEELPIDKSKGDNGWLADGPVLPIEFSRISKGNRLTLVIDESGNDVQTLWAHFTTVNLNAAIEGLAKREKMPNTKNIGFIDLVNEKKSDSYSQMEIKRITSWAKQKGVDAAIWTGLKPNFAKRALELFNEPRDFTINNVQWFLERLQNDEFIAARDYILNAPQSTNTKCRVEIENLFKTVIPEQVFVHEAGHILLAKAFGCEIDDIVKNFQGSPIVVKYSKAINGAKYEGVIYDGVNPLAIKANWERTIITQGGWAAEKMHEYRIEDQFKKDLENANVLLAQLPISNYTLERAQEFASQIILSNKATLLIMKDDLKKLYNGDKKYDFKLFYSITNIPDVHLI